MRVHGLLPERRLMPPRPRGRHEGKRAAAMSNQRGCSEGLEFRRDNGESLRVTLALDSCDCEAMNWTAATRSLSG
jgi:putative transposase